MFNRKSDTLADAVRLLAASVAVVSDPTLLSALRSGPGGYDALKRLAADPPPGVARLAGDLAAEARALFDATRDLPPDAEALFAQMVEAGLVAGPEIVAADMDAGAVVEAMLGKLTAPEHRTGPMRALFRAITTPTLARLLGDRAFADDLRAAFMAEVLRRLGDLGAKLEQVHRLTRLEMTALGDRFEIKAMHGLSDAELREALEKKAEEYRAYRAQIEAIDARTAGLGNLKAAAKDAAERLDFDAVEALLGRVHEVELDVAAETAVLRADNALLRGRVEDAFRMLSAAADGFDIVSSHEAARRRLEYCARLFEHGRRYGSEGLALADRMIRRALANLSEHTESELWASGQNWLGNALVGQGERTGGEAGALLLEAETAYRAALRVRTEAAHPLDWAATQDNLGIALARQGGRLEGDRATAMLDLAVEAHRAALRVWTPRALSVQWAMTQANLGVTLRARGQRTDGEAGMALLGESVAAHRSALQVWTETEFPTDWAITQSNLGNALREQGSRLGGEAGASLLGEAVAAHSAALRVQTEATHPMGWAATTKSLGLALRVQGERLGGAVGAALLGEAVAAYRAALRARTEAAHPVDWATTQNDLGAALFAQAAQLGGAARAALLGEAVAAFRAALRVRTKAAHPVDWARTTENLGLAHGTLAGSAGCADPRAALAVAEACFAMALRVYDLEHLPYDHRTATAALARVRGMLGRG